MFARRLMQIGLVSLSIGCSQPAPPTAPPAEFELLEASVVWLQELMTSGQYTSRRINELYMARIAQIDAAGQTLRSIIQVNPDALAIADALDEERRTRGPRGPLHGVPILVKDNIDTGDKMPTTAGSLALQKNVASMDAFVVAQLRKAGAVILGKTNLSEWANFRSTKSTSGWSAVGGLVRNPYVLDRNPCGSSSGTGAAIAASLAGAGIGTETDGSIVCPSSANSLVGIKPTVGLVSRTGIVPIAHSFDTAGPMARSVTDAAIILSAIVGVDARDAATATAPPASGRPYTDALNPNALKGARIGVARAYFGYSPAADRLTEAAIASMKSQGAIILDPVAVPPPRAFESCQLEVLLYEFKSDLNSYLGARGPGVMVRSLAEVIQFNEREREKEMPHFGQELFTRAEAKGPLTEAAYVSALSQCRALAREGGIDEALRSSQLDAIVAPTIGPPWPTDLVNGDAVGGSSSTLAAIAGYPSITVPGGFVGELPVGISFIGGAWSESQLIGLAYAYEQATRHRHAPTFRPTIPLE